MGGEEGAVEARTQARKRKLEEILDSEDEGDDEDYGWVEGDEEDWPPPPPQTQGSEDILVVPVEDDEETEEEEELQEEVGEEDQETDEDELRPSELIRRKERDGREITQDDIDAYAEEMLMGDFEGEIPDV